MRPPARRPAHRQAPGVSRRDHEPADSGTPYRGSVILAVVLSIVAIVVAGAALGVVLVRGPDQAAQPDTTGRPDGHLVAVPNAAALPSGWTIASTRFLVDVLTTTLAGPTPSGSTQGPTAFISISCYGNDAQLAFARDHDSAVGAGSTDVSMPPVGDEIGGRHEHAHWAAPRSSSGAEVLVADITAPTTVDMATLESVAGAVDGAMTQALSASPRPSSGGASPGPAASPAAQAIDRTGRESEPESEPGSLEPQRARPRGAPAASGQRDGPHEPERCRDGRSRDRRDQPVADRLAHEARQDGGQPRHCRVPRPRRRAPDARVRVPRHGRDGDGPRHRDRDELAGEHDGHADEIGRDDRRPRASRR